MLIRMIWDSSSSTRYRVRKLIFLLLITPVLLAPSSASAIIQTVFGPTTYERAEGPPQEILDNFAVKYPNIKYTLKVYNGGLQDAITSGNRVSSAEIKLNNKIIVAPNDFNQNVGIITVPVEVTSNNTLAIEIRSAPGSKFTVEIIGEGNLPPTANTGSPQTGFPGDTILLDGSGSSDPENAPLSYAWSMLSAPAGSAAVLSANDIVSPGFVPDVPGQYTIKLIVNDGEFDSEPALVIITIETPLDSDGDGIFDHIEIREGTDPSNPDTDGDTLSDGDEVYKYLTDPLKADTDGDTFDDGTEVAANTDPKDPASFPVTDKPKVTIVSPINGAVINSDVVQVEGSLEGPANTGVSVNGHAATIIKTNGSRSFYVNVPIEPGSNIILAVATSPAGNSEKQEIAVTAVAPPDIYVTSNNNGDVAPAITQFEVIDRNKTGISQILIDFDGDGTSDLTSDGSESVFKHTYDLPGVYTALFSIYDINNVLYEQTIKIVIQDKEYISSVLMQLWDSMNVALLAGDVPKALIHISQDSSDEYRQIFEALLPEMGQIMASQTHIEPIEINGRIASYAFLNARGDVFKAYIINFDKSADGIWRIESF